MTRHLYDLRSFWAKNKHYMFVNQDRHRNNIVEINKYELHRTYNNIIT